MGRETVGLFLRPLSIVLLYVDSEQYILMSVLLFSNQGHETGAQCG